MGDILIEIYQSEYDDLVEQINMLQELIAELSAPVDTAQEQQAYTYQQMQKVLVGHPSFKELSEGSHCEELVGTIVRLQSAYDELAEVSKKVEFLESTNANLNMEYPEQFKPVSEYTLKDWALACTEGWEFECRHGGAVTIQHVSDYSHRPVFCSDQYYHSVNGMWDAEEGEDIDDIIKRIK